MPTQGTAENVLTSFTFSLEIDDVTQQVFTSVDGLSISVEVVDSWGSDASAKIFEQKVAASTTFGDITVEANFSTNSFIRDWRQGGRRGQVRRRTAATARSSSTTASSTSRPDGTSSTPGRPRTRWVSSPPATRRSMSESITIVHEGLERA